MAGWTAEIAGTYWLAAIQLAFTLNDAELITSVTNWVHDVIAPQDEDGFLGIHRPEDNRLEDYCVWGNNRCYRALLSYFDAADEQAVLEAVHRALLWFVQNWTGDKRLFDWAEEYKIWLANGHDEFHHRENPSAVQN